jgi:hypothetical protein
MFLEIAINGKNHWWRYLLTILLVVLGVLLGQMPLLGVISFAANRAGLSDAEVNEAMANLDFASAGLDDNIALVFMLLPFAAGLGTLWLCAHFIHKKDFRSFINPLLRINWRKVLFGFGFWILITAAAELAFWAVSPQNYFTAFDFSKFIFLLPIALILLPIQTSFEEVFFRGYLMQGIGLIGVFRWVPLLITSIAFGAMHFMNPEVAAFGLVPTMFYYIGTGLFLGVITLMDDSLELALGVHAATNIFSALFVTFDDSALQTAAIFHTTEINMLNMLIALAIGVALFLYVASQRFGWTDWSKCYARIIKTKA